MKHRPKGKFIILSGPSGVGKNTIASFLLEKFPRLQFAVSATSRPMRPGEEEGINYYYFSNEAFQEIIDADGFLEWAQVYEGQKYGTLWREVHRIWDAGKVMISDIDVLGGMQLKEKLGKHALAIFLAPPSLEELEQRLRSRGTDSEEKIKMRLARVKEEMTYQQHYDVVIINDTLEQAQQEVARAITQFLDED